MINYHTDLVAILNTILPTHYEMQLTSATKAPCISYMELSNIAEEEGDTVGYSRLQYQIKVWDNDIATIQKYALEIDKALRPLGWKRISASQERWQQPPPWRKRRLREDNLECSRMGNR